MIINCERASVMRCILDNLVILFNVCWSDLTELQDNHIVYQHICNALILFKGHDD